MATDSKIRWGWLKFMYIYTIAAAGAFGLAILVDPNVTKVFGWSTEEPLTLGITGSVYLAFAIMAVFGLREPLKFAPILALQLGYKSIWFVGVVLPLVIAGRLPSYALLAVGIFAVFVVGDLIAIPFRVVFGKGAERE